MDVLLDSMWDNETRFLNRQAEHLSSLRDTIERLQAENDQLKAEREDLRAENEDLRAQGYEPDPDVVDAALAGAEQKEAEPGLDEDTVPETAGEYKLEQVIRAHGACVHCAALGPMGMLATASWDKLAHVYDLSKDDDEALIMTLGDDEANQPPDEPMGGLYCVAFSTTAPNLIACASSDTYAYLWDYASGECRHRFEGHTDEVNGVVFHPSQQVMCTSSDDGTAIIWDFVECQQLRVLGGGEDVEAGHEKQVYGASFLGAEFEKCVATCCFDQVVRIWDMRTAEVVIALQQHTNDICGIEYSESAGKIVTGSDDGLACIWDARVASAEEEFTMPLFVINTREHSLANDENEVKRVTWSLDGTRIACGTSSQYVLIYDVSGDSPMEGPALGGHTDCVFDMCWGEDSNGKEFIVDASHDTTSFVWRPRV